MARDLNPKNNRHRKFQKPIHLSDGTVISTLSEARKWLLGIGSDQKEFQNAAGAVLKAADGGSLEKARGAVSNAAFINMKLDPSKE